ncbi:hypothetical protein AB0L13_38760 [Saccharopolyspora shandongensis]|uniref:hypothetical protein n=1 Tax=Saccharopolyspora shandongensis TaxID=418495 RepID=UPI00341695BC
MVEVQHRARRRGQRQRSSLRLVERSGEFPVRGPRRVELAGAFVELALQLDNVSLKDGDLLLEAVDVDGCAEARVVPGVFAEQFGKPSLELPPGGQARVAFQGVGKVGLQGRSGHAGLPLGRGRGGCGGVDAFQQVTVAIEERSADSSDAGNAGDGC